MTNKKQGVLVALDPIKVTVENTEDQQLLIKRAQEAVAQKIKESFPIAKYSLVEEDVLSMNEVIQGMVVEAKGKPLIITHKTKKNVRAVMKGNQLLSGPPAAFKKSNKSYKDAFVPRRVMQGMEDFFTEGDCGYLEVEGERVPVVIGATIREKTKLYRLDKLGTEYTASQKQLEQLFFDSLEAK